MLNGKLSNSTIDYKFGVAYFIDLHGVITEALTIREKLFEKKPCGEEFIKFAELNDLFKRNRW